MNEILFSLLAGSLLVNILTMILVIVLLKKVQRFAVQEVGIAEPQLSSSKTNEDTGLGVVFCRNCGQQYDSKLASCPNCETPRG